jgi:hypothetical protein
LDIDEPLTLAVVTLTTLAGGAGIAPAELIARIEQRVDVGGADLGSLFRRRLDTVGYLPDPLYSKPMFRLDGIEYFDVSGDFPRIRRNHVAAGIEKLVYDLMVGSCVPYKSSLRR